MAKQTNGRTFVKKVGDEELVRIVHTPSDEVNAKYEGFTEQATTGPKPSAGTSSGSSTGKAAGSSPS